MIPEFYLLIAFSLGILAAGIPLAYKNIQLKADLDKAAEMLFKITFGDVLKKVFKDAEEDENIPKTESDTPAE